MQFTYISSSYKRHSIKGALYSQKEFLGRHLDQLGTRRLR